MSTTLRVFVGESWPEKPATRWVLLSAAGELQQQGESDALRWPASDYCEAVITAPETSWLRGNVPARVSKRDIPQVLAGVLEDQLLDDPDRCHMTMCGRDGEAVDVLVMARTRLRNIVTQFSALSRPLVAAYAELQNVAPEAGAWVVALTAGATVLVRPGEVPLTLDVPEDGLPSELLVALAGQDRPPSLKIRAEAGRRYDLAAWQSRLGLEGVRTGDEYHWYQVPGNAANLLHGEFASRQKRNNWWLVVKPAALVAAGAVLAYAAVGVVQLGWANYRIGADEARIADLFHSAFPNVPAMAPAAQARRQLDSLRVKHGMTASDDVVVLLAALSDSLGPAGDNLLIEAKYADRRLLVLLQPTAADLLSGLRRDLEGRGYRVVAEATPEHVSVSIHLDMTR